MAGVDVWGVRVAMDQLRVLVLVGVRLLPRVPRAPSRSPRPKSQGRAAPPWRGGTPPRPPPQSLWRRFFTNRPAETRCTDHRRPRDAGARALAGPGEKNPARHDRRHAEEDP